MNNVAQTGLSLKRFAPSFGLPRPPPQCRMQNSKDNATVTGTPKTPAEKDGLCTDVNLRKKLKWYFVQTNFASK